MKKKKEIQLPTGHWKIGVNSPETKKWAIRILDGCCCAGACSEGYARAAEELGFECEITGVDIEPQKRYPFMFIQGDIIQHIKEHGHYYDFIHCSFPCQKYSITKSLHSNEHPDLIDVGREALIATGKPYVIENVPGAPLKNYVELCGSMFGLKVIRHRLFECNPRIDFPPFSCNCSGTTMSHRGGDSSFANGAKNITVAGHSFKVEDAKIAMGIDWMIGKELAQAIPPAYTHWLGLQIFSKFK
jgi:DNA (cytosine-5)-methyltransferase 1